MIDGARRVTVKLTDRREFTAKVLGVDKQTDVALIDANNLPTVAIGDPSRLRVGEPVLASALPTVFENTATAGIVSAKSRNLPDDNYVPFIQTDVAVNPATRADRYSTCAEKSSASIRRSIPRLAATRAFHSPFR